MYRRGWTTQKTSWLLSLYSKDQATVEKNRNSDTKTSNHNRQMSSAFNNVLK